MTKRRRTLVLLLCALLLAIPASGVWLLRSKRPSPPPLQGQLRRDAIDVDGRRRTFALYVPRRLRPAPPLLLVLHSSMANGATIRAASGYSFDEIADREGILVAYPDGHAGQWNDCRAAGDFEAKRLRIDDVAFLRALTARLRGEYAVPAAAVFAAGLSNGAQMSYRLALEAPDLVRGIAAIAANLPAEGNQACRPAGKPVATMIVNGTGDPLNPHEGGEVALYGLFMRRGTVQSTLASAQYWATLAGLHGPPSEHPLPDADPNDGARAVRLLWSAPNAPSVAAVIVAGGGHTMPHPHVTSPRLLGRTCHDLSAPELIWDFFAAELRRH